MSVAFYRDISGIQTFSLRKECPFLVCQISLCVSGIWEMENYNKSMYICSLITFQWELMNISVQNALCYALICWIVSDSLRSHGLWSATVTVTFLHGDSPGKNTGVVVMPCSRGSSQPRDRSQVTHIAGEFFTSWAAREASKCTRKDYLYDIT